MSKPWDNEPSPEADKSWMYPPSFDADIKVVSHEKFANLEHRLRHAEDLLLSALPHINSPEIAQQVLVHLQKARVEDDN